MIVEAQRSYFRVRNYCLRAPSVKEKNIRIGGYFCLRGHAIAFLAEDNDVIIALQASASQTQRD
jgi:hypothetical protein